MSVQEPWEGLGMASVLMMQGDLLRHSSVLPLLSPHNDQAYTLP